MVAAVTRVVHLKRPSTNLTMCGEDGPHYVKTFDRNLVTCNKCIRRAGKKMHVLEAQALTPGRLVQPGGGHRR